MLKHKIAVVALTVAAAVPGCEATGSAPAATSNAQDSPTSTLFAPDASIGATGSSHEEGNRSTKEYLDCKAKAQGAIEMSDCISDERDREDARLNAIYEDLVKLLVGDRRTRLIEAQRVWIQLQEMDGTFESSMFDDLGQLGNLQAGEHEVARIRARSDQLEQYLELVR